MALVDVEPSARGRAWRGTKKAASREPHGGGRVATPAARGFLGALRKSIWAPIALRAFGVLAGMLALAAVGASSIARGSGVPVPPPSAEPAARVVTAGIAPLSTPGDAGADAGDGGVDAGRPASSAITADGRVVLNLAGVDELRRIPGVGPKRAQAIVDLRTKLGGRFKRIADLLRVRGIGVKSLRKIEAYVVLDAPRASEPDRPDAGSAEPPHGE